MKEKATGKADGLTVITTHVNADFDALASMLAAQKLYPEALVVFAGAQERSIRDFFMDSAAYLFNWVKIREVDLDAVQRLVLVDTRQKGRIGKFADLIDRPEIDIHIYDHHPPMSDDIAGSVEFIMRRQLEGMQDFKTITDEEAAFLQRIAWETVQEYETPQ